MPCLSKGFRGGLEAVRALKLLLQPVFECSPGCFTGLETSLESLLLLQMLPCRDLTLQHIKLSED